MIAEAGVHKLTESVEGSIVGVSPRWFKPVILKYFEKIDRLPKILMWGCDSKCFETLINGFMTLNGQTYRFLEG